MKVNLYGETFMDNKISELISSTVNQVPDKIEFVTDGSGICNIFVDSGIYKLNDLSSTKKNYAWILESKSIRPDIINHFLDDIKKRTEPFEKVFTHNRQLLELDDKFTFLHPTGYWVDDNVLIHKTKLVSMITSNKKNTPLQKKRVRFAKRNRMKIDLYGNGFNYISNKEDGLIDYFFSVAYENDDTDDYFSEKVLDCFATKTIPIYYGSKNIKNYFNEEGIIFFDDYKYKNLSASFYNHNIDAVNENYEKVKKYRVPEDTIYSFLNT